MKRRRVVRDLAFGAMLSIGALLVPLSSSAQQSSAMARIGFVAPQGRSLPLFDAFRQGLADLGYVEGKNVVIEARFAEGRYERLPDLFAELAALQVDVIAVTGAVTARAAMKADAGVPIVFAVVVDPVADHVVSNMDHPGGNITGTTSFDPQQAEKQLRLLKELLPALKRVAILGDQGVSPALINASEAQAKAIGLEALPIRVSATSPPIEEVFDTLRQKQSEALVVLEEPVVGVLANRIAELAANAKLPTLFAPSRAAAGGLVDYGTSQVQSIRRMAAYVDKILKGVEPGDLPVERVAPYELVVNLKTARQIGVAIPSEVLKRAERVIQ
jgi:putative tryptophan/tyrosine transport system substrate-binding protein